MTDELPPRPVDPGRRAGVTADPAPERTSANRRAIVLTLVVVLAVLVLGALAGGSNLPGGATFPPVGATAGQAGSAAAVTRGEVARALAASGLQLEDATTTYRPAEAPAFATAPRIVVRAILPDDPGHGLLLIYEFLDQATAVAAAEAQAAYVGGGVGRVQFPNDTRFVIRVLGSTAVFYAWSPPTSADRRAPTIEAALETLGIGVPVPG